MKRGHVWRGVYEVKGQRNPWRYRCPAPMCFSQGGYDTQKDADKYFKTHECPWFGGGTTTLSWGIMSTHYIEPLWKELDELVDIIRNPEADAAHKSKLRDVAWGYCHCLAKLMPPFFSTPREIGEEAARRWEARKAEKEYTTPGTGRLRWKTPTEAAALTPGGIPIGEYTGEVRHNLGPMEVQAIVAAKDFAPAPMLAQAYKVSERVINHIWETDGA